MRDAGARVATSSSSFWPHSLLFPQMLHTSLLRNAALLLKAVPGSDKVDSEMSQLTDGSLVVVVILDVQVAAARQGKKGDFGRSWQNFAPLSPPPAGKSAKQLRQAEGFTASALMQRFHTYPTEKEFFSLQYWIVFHSFRKLLTSKN